MHLKIKENIKEDDFNMILGSHENDFILDLGDVKYLSSKEITKLLVLIKEHNKKIEFINCNEHIIETIKVLNLGEIIKLKI